MFIAIEPSQHGATTAKALDGPSTPPAEAVTISVELRATRDARVH